MGALLGIGAASAQLEHPLVLWCLDRNLQGRNTMSTARNTLHTLLPTPKSDGLSNYGLEWHPTKTRT